MDFLFEVITFCFAGTLQEYQRRMKKLDQQYKERLRNAGMPRKFLPALSHLLNSFAVPR